MRRYSKQIIAVICSFAILFTSFVVPASATSADAGEYVKQGFEKYLELSAKLADPLLPIRPFLDFWAELKKTSAVPDTAYTDYVNTLPAKHVTSDSFYLPWSSSLCYVEGGYQSAGFSFSGCAPVSFSASTSLAGRTIYRAYLIVPFDVPCAGKLSFSMPSYKWGGNLNDSLTFLRCDSSPSFPSNDSPLIVDRVNLGLAQSKATSGSVSFSAAGRVFLKLEINGLFEYTSVSGCFYPPSFRWTSASPSVSTPVYVPPVDTRTGSLAGNFGYYDTSGKLIPVKNIHIVNETDNSVYNPVTNTTTNFTNWTYDYSTRTYTLTIDNSTTQTITYGDQYITINQGDTITNIYYVTPPPVDPPPTPPPASCVHAYTPAVTTAPSCVLSGVKTFTCSKCKDAYTEKIPATGHSWAVKATIPTAYDTAGVLVTQGYTIYKCSVCGEEYKSTDGSAPPGGSTESGKGNIWDKLGSLLGTAATGFITVLKTAVVKILDALVSLFEAINAKLASVTTAIFGLFDRIPQLFGGFTGFLSAVFPFLPVEVFDILTLTILLLAAATLIKFFMKR